MKGEIIRIPALADVHVHFREPGYSYKETIRCGSEAAAAGGYTCVCTMPNLNPVPDSPEHLEEELSIIRRDAVIDVRPYAAITVGRKGLVPVDVAALKDACCAFSDDGSGVQDEKVMFEAMKMIAANGCILAAHCEDNSLIRDGVITPESEWRQIERDVDLAKTSGCAYHVCHVSTAESVDIIRRAKAGGVNVSCETAPHYLKYCSDDITDDGRFKMNPPLRSSADRSALIEGILDGTIDMIATDHAPHSAEEKGRGFEGSVMGIIGLETAFPVMYTEFVRTGILSLDKLVKLMSTAPRTRFRLGGSGDYAEFNVSEPYVIDPAQFRTMGRSTPFEGLEVFGRCVRTVWKGKEVYNAL